MDFSYILRTSVPVEEKLLKYGFRKENGVFLLRKTLEESGFYGDFSLSEKEFNASVFEISTGEKYALVDVARAKGSFVNGIREIVKREAEEIEKNCFIFHDLRSDYEKALKERFETLPDFPWKDTPEYAVYRCRNGKWFALIMHISFKSLGIQSEEKVWCVNLKADPEKIPEITDKVSVFPAYHMNKKYWITVLLSAVTNFEKLLKLTEDSRKLVEGN